MEIYDIAVIGGGAAGTMAAIRAGQLNKKVVLIERNASLGKKLLLTGNGRCNLTNTAPIEIFIDKFGKQGQFLRTAFFTFFNEEMMHFCKSNSLKLKIEAKARVFPATNQAASVVKILKNCLAQNKVQIIYNRRLIDIQREDNTFKLELEGKDNICARKVILATGGTSYRLTGSTGDGFRLAARLGHKVVPLKPALVPLCTKEKWVNKLQGLSLENVRVSFAYGRKKVVSEIGELLFTHFGLSGPLVLDLSAEVVATLEKAKEIPLFIELKPELSSEQLEKKLLQEFKHSGTRQIKNIIKSLLPQRLIPVFIRLAGLDAQAKANQMTQKQRHLIINLFRALPITIVGSRPIEEAMVASGGISTEELNPRTMESKIVPGLYCAGEIINGCAPSGGYNLQKAFSTGYLAGEKAAYA